MKQILYNVLNELNKYFNKCTNKTVVSDTICVVKEYLNKRNEEK